MLKVYTKENCIQCKMSKRDLQKNNIPYQEIDITGNPQIIAELKEQGWKQMPVLVFADESWSGYRPDKIRSLKEG